MVYRALCTSNKIGGDYLQAPVPKGGTASQWERGLGEVLVASSGPPWPRKPRLREPLTPCPSHREELEFESKAQYFLIPHAALGGASRGVGLGQGDLL